MCSSGSTPNASPANTNSPSAGSPRPIAAHLRGDAALSWQGLNFDFTGVVFDGGSFSDAKFSGGGVFFTDAEFSGSTVNFTGAKFSGSMVGFTGAKFTDGTVSFSDAKFSGGTVDFGGAADWSHSPKFDWEGTPPLGGMLPTVGADGLVIPPSAAPAGPTSS